MENKTGSVWGDISHITKENVGETGEEMIAVSELEAEPLNIETAMQFILDERNEIVTALNENAEQAEYYEFKYNELLEESEANKELLVKATDLADKYISLRTDYNELLKKNAVIGESYKATVTNYELLKGQKDTVDKQLKVAQKELKKLKKLSSGHKASNDTLRKANARLTAQLKEKPNYNATDDLPQLNFIYQVNDEVLIVYPQRHKMNNGTQIVEQTVLLYSDMRGVYLTVCLDENNNAVFSSPLNPNTLSERTLATIEKNMISPSKEAQAYATQWLYRVNIEQKMKVERFDLAKFTGE